MSKDILPKVVSHVSNTRTISGGCRSSTAIIIVLYPNQVRCDKSCHEWLVESAIGPRRVHPKGLGVCPTTTDRLGSAQHATNQIARVVRLVRTLIMTRHD